MKEELLMYQTEVHVARAFYYIVKRIIDIFLSIIGVICLLPIAFIIKVLYVVSGDFHSIFYYQERVGKYGKHFKLYKFRTMVPNAETILAKWLDENPKIREEYYKNRKLSHDPRITKVGKFLRVSSLDEMPQFINIFLGDMSFIGPRPVLEDEANNYGVKRGKFLSVRPGLTGYWACHGRSCTSYEERKKMELYYVDHCSIWLDIKIVFWTVIKVVKGEGAQ